MRSGCGFDGIRAVTFDAGGTLLVPHPSVGAIYREVLLRHGSDLREDDLERGFRSAFSSVSKDASVPDPEARERDFWRRVVQHTIADLDGVQPRTFEPFFDELWETFAHASRWRVLDDVVPMLRALRTRGLRLAILSNWDQRLHTVLNESGLRELFDVIIISSEVGCEKPDAGIFRAAERALNATPATCLHIGDSRKHDLAGARGAGWLALIVRHDAGVPEGETIGSLGQLLDLLPLATTR